MKKECIMRCGGGLDQISSEIALYSETLSDGSEAHQVEIRKDGHLTKLDVVDYEEGRKLFLTMERLVFNVSMS